MTSTAAPPTGRLRIRDDRLRELMHDARITNYAALCLRMGMTKASLSRVRNGHAQPGPRMISRLTDVLGASISDLFETVPDETPAP